LTPWLLDTERLLLELSRVRGLALNIPAVRNDILGPINSVIDALWDLEERLRYCFHLHCDGQRSFAKKDANSLSGKPKLLDQVRDAIRLSHYSIRTEHAYTDWIKRFDG
jgi:hypothetical protein